jgi:hypothetical protein
MYCVCVSECLPPWPEEQVASPLAPSDASASVQILFRQALARAAGCIICTHLAQ